MNSWVTSDLRYYDTHWHNYNEQHALACELLVWNKINLKLSSYQCCVQSSYCWLRRESPAWARHLVAGMVSMLRCLPLLQHIHLRHLRTGPKLKQTSNVLIKYLWHCFNGLQHTCLKHLQTGFKLKQITNNVFMNHSWHDMDIPWKVHSYNMMGAYWDIDG